MALVLGASGLSMASAAEPENLVNLARNAAVKARTRLESPPLWSKDSLVDGVYAAGGYSSRADAEGNYVRVTLKAGTLTGACSTPSTAQ
jgi:hypothetical protein